MFTVHLDLEVIYVPPMEEHARGIVLSRTLELPFAPHEGLQAFGKELDEWPGPVGFGLDEVACDLDRKVLLAKTMLTVHDFPPAFIESDLRMSVGKVTEGLSRIDSRPT